MEEVIWDDGMFTHSFVNSREFFLERWDKFEQAGFTRPFPEGMRFDDFVEIPWLSIDPRYHPDFFGDGVDFVSPKLAALLDQPAGSLQILPTRTEWRTDFGVPPDWSYLWLSNLPVVPAIDLDRSEVVVEDVMQDGQPMRTIEMHAEGRLVLRDDFVPPCGLFRPAEDRFLLLATDAVAEAVLKAGCFGVEFVEVETIYARSGALRRRGLNGVELHPDGVQWRRDNYEPVPDA